METPTITTIHYSGLIHPEYSKVISTVGPATIGSKLKKIFIAFIGSGFVAGICYGAGHSFGWAWLQYTGFGLGGLIFVISIYEAIGSQFAPCPYCGDQLGKTSDVTISKKDTHKQIECPKCFEWLVSEMGQVRAYKETDIKDEKEFISPLFVSGIWPNECIVCGKPVVKYCEAKNTKLNVGKLLVGRISVAWGSIKNVPYCAEHEDVVKLKVDDPKMNLIFNDYAARRRYLAVNPMRIPSKVK
jgi:hypothetical protein